ncbi:MAG: trypsin-like peptidase domain-containing protein [Candidatus Nezhaarchaeota archaeon]|nr:trypsin-like peptidase domain-containing protein [Candidatus Nezhaarchaeota archaeon]
MSYTEEVRRSSLRLVVVLAIILACSSGALGFFLGYWSSSSSISYLQSQVTSLQSQLSQLQRAIEALRLSEVRYHVVVSNVSLPGLYEGVKDSVVMVRSKSPQLQAQGSGFIYNFSGRLVVVTNYHVVAEAAEVTVRLASGDEYLATVLGSDPYADLAVLSVNAPLDKLKPLEVVSSSTLRVGDVVIAVGNPYGLVGSLSIGVVSALGRTIAVEQAGGYPIANVIQTTTPLNPGNSGGPLLNLRGQVVGVTTAIVRDSQGLGFAIPSNTILREIASLVVNGTYDRHPWLGAAGMDVTFDVAKERGLSVTYGWLVTDLVRGGPAEKAGLRRGDVIVEVDGARVRGIDDLASYLEEYASPGQVVELTVVRGSDVLTILVVLGARPPLQR